MQDNEPPNSNTPDYHYCGRRMKTHEFPGVETKDAADVHLAVPLHVPGPAAAIVAQMALALDNAGIAVSLHPGGIAANVDRTDRARLEAMMRRSNGRRFHIHWSPCPGHDAVEEEDCVVRAEFFVPDHASLCTAVIELDLATRQVVMNSRRKITFRQHDHDFLTTLGVPAERCVVIPLASLSAEPAGRRAISQDQTWRQAAELLWQALLRFEDECRRTVTARTLVPVAPGKVSVVAATYNRPEALKEFLSAYREQTLPTRSWELILVDDCSNYSVAELVREHGAGLPVRLLQNSTNQSAGQSRNRAIPLTTGDIVLFTGDDIIPDENLLAEHLRIHRARDEHFLGVLGFIDWHPDVEVSPLLAYITGEGGQQFAYYHMQAGSFVGTDNFYTSNVSVRRSLLVGQEELFSRRFATYYGHEDLELGVRLGRAGLRLLYHPLASATHRHPMTDRSVLERQYNVGRSCIVFSLLQPKNAAPENWLYIRWLERAQRHLHQQRDVEAIAEDLARVARGLEDWLDAVMSVWPTLGPILGSFADDVGRTPPPFDRLQKSLFCLRLDLATRSGMADEWMGVRAGAPNIVRDLTHLFMCAEVWRLFDRPTRADAHDSAGPAATLSLQLANRLRRHPRLAPLWDCLELLPGFSAAKSAARGLLRRCA